MSLQRLILFIFLIIPAVVIVREHNISAMFNINKQVAQDSRIKFDRPLKVLDHGGYDGQYYLMHSYDLKNKSGVVPKEYASRIFIPSIVHVIGSFFNFSYNPEIFLAINTICLFLLYEILIILFKKNAIQTTLLSGLLFFPNIGLLTSFRYQLTEIVSATFLFCSFLLIEKIEKLQYWILFIILVSCSLLTRDAFIYAPLGLGVYSLVNRKWKLSLGLIFSTLPMLVVRYMTMGTKSDLPLISLSSIYQFAITSIDFSNPLTIIKTNLFWILVILLVLSLYFILKDFKKANPYQYIALFLIVFLGFFNPTSAWSNITGIGRHLAILFPILPLAIQKHSQLKILQLINVVCIFIFFTWFFIYFPQTQIF